MGQVCHTATPCFVVQLCCQEKGYPWTRPFSSVISVRDLEFVKTIGQGSFGQVRLARLRNFSQPLAVKVMSKANLVLNKQISQIYVEKAILQHLVSSFAVEFYGTLQDEDSLYCLMEFLPGGELFKYICKKNRLPPAEARFYTTEVTAAINDLHKCSCIYRDLKPENVMIRSSGHIKLIDFGLGNIIGQNEKTHTICGTPEYLAPEVVDRTGHDGAVDWWQLGILLYEMLASVTPFADPSPYKLYENILLKIPVYPPEFFDARTKSLLQGLLCKDPAVRLTDEDVLAHPYFADTDWRNVRRLGLRPPFRPHLSDPFDTSHFDEFPEEQAKAPSSHTSSSAFGEYCETAAHCLD